jgi:predicted metal-binding membrane protein
MSLGALDWLGAAGAFIAMWLVMMVAMMLPSLVPALLRYRRVVRGVEEFPLSGLTALAGAGYFAVWSLFGLVVFPLGALSTAAVMQSPALSTLAPFVPGGVLLLAGGYQLTAWKVHQLNHCRQAPSLTADAGSAWRHGITLGVHCSLCCLGFMAVLLVNGVMDLGVMALVAAAITFERLVPWPERAARVTGIILLLIGAAFIARAAGVV